MFHKGVFIFKNTSNESQVCYSHFFRSSPEDIIYFHFRYKGFEAAYHAGCLNLLTFDDENDSKVLALNFSSQEEAANFKLHLDKRREQEQKSGELNATVQS